MELRKDPITRSWVVVGHPDEASAAPDGCLLCPGHEAEHAALLTLPPQGPWQIRVVPHFNPLYRIEGEPGRQADGIYDRRSEERRVGKECRYGRTPEQAAHNIATG